MKQLCEMHEETQESVCFSSAVFSSIMCMYSHQHVFIFGENLVFLCMLIQVVDILKSAWSSMTILPYVREEALN